MPFGFILRYIKKNRLFSAGVNNFMQGKYEEALKCFDDIVEISPKMALAHVNRGLCLLKCNRKDEARASFVTGRDLFPANPAPHVWLGQLCYEAGDFKEAEDHLKEALKVDKTHPEAMYYLGLTYLKQGLTEEAALAFEPMVNDRKNYILARMLCAAEKILQDNEGHMKGENQDNGD